MTQEADCTEFRERDRPFSLSGRLPGDYAAYFASLESRVRAETSLTERDIGDVGHNELVFDRRFLEDLNRQIRSFSARWIATDSTDTHWPDDLLVIGGSGCGDYYCISSSGAFAGVRMYEHEAGAFSEFAESFDHYYEMIMADIRKRHTT